MNAFTALGGIEYLFTVGIICHRVVFR